LFTYQYCYLSLLLYYDLVSLLTIKALIEKLMVGQIVKFPGSYVTRRFITMKFVVFTAVTMKKIVFWYVTPCNLVKISDI
jgi:hypothetical protein